MAMLRWLRRRTEPPNPVGLLRSATEWHSQYRMELEIGGYEVQVFTMDSAFLHARTLFEFFTRPTQDFFYGYDAYGLTSKIKSVLYEKHWSGPLHARLMHAQDRSKPSDIRRFEPGQPKEHIKNMAVDFAKEIVRMWREFARALNEIDTTLGQRALVILDEAVQAADLVRTNDVTEDQIAQRKEDGRLESDFSIPQIEWPSAP
jgi:hypothetical protein